MKWRDRRAILKKSLIAMVFIGAISCCRALVQGPKATIRGSKRIHLSLWLIPPLSVAMTLEERISLYSSTSGAPKFDPHVTVVGGIPCDSIDGAKKLAQRLQQELAGFGEISAAFQPKAQNFDTWNQALVFEMDASPKFVRLCQRARKLLNMETKNLFPPPLNAPHFSLFYGVDNVPKADKVEPIPDFTSSKLALWLTDPANTDGVPQWEFLDEVSLT